VDEMAHHVERAPGVGAFVDVVPGSARAAEKGACHGRSALQDVECLREIEAHYSPLFLAGLSAARNVAFKMIPR
jgi:hypothetical protein